MIGQQIMPESHDPIVSTLPHEEVTSSIESMCTAMEGVAARMPTHEEFIARYCPAGAS